MSMLCLQVLFAVFKGKRLEMPPQAPSKFAALVTACMAQKPAERPTFLEIQGQLADLEQAADSRALKL